MKDATPPQRVRDAAWLLPLAGLALLMPPFVTLFTGDADVLGVPRIIVYVFGVWLALIGAAALLARRLRPPPG
jgi:O-antigen/teichoic acid export membrane protein